MTDNAIITVPEYTETAKALAELEGRMANVVHDVTTGKGMTAAKKDVAELRALWVALEERRKAIKAPALERCRLIDTEAKTLEARLKGLAEPIKAQIEAEEQRKEREKAAREQAERDRIAAIHARFDAVKALPLQAVNATADEIRELILDARATDTSFPADDKDAEPNSAALAYELRLAVASLRAALDRKEAQDAEQAKIEQERAELEKLRQEREAMQAEMDRLAAAEREREAAEARRIEEAARAEREAAEQAAREAHAAEQARIDAERAEQRKREDAEREAAAKVLRDEQAKAAAERELLEREKAAAAKAARDAEIANTTLIGAAAEAVTLLEKLGEADNIITKKLAAALRRESMEKAA